MTEPKGEKPHSEHPGEDDLPLEFALEHEDIPVTEEHPAHAEPEAGAEEPNPLSELGLGSSTEGFNFAGPAEELDFNEPTDFAFPTEEAAEAAGASSTELATGEQFFGSEEAAPLDAAEGEEGTIEAESASDGVADLETAEEPAEEGEEEEPKKKKSRPKREVPLWVHVAEWITIGCVATSALLALLISVFQLDKPGRVNLVLNICCPLMLALIPYSLWRSSARWVKPAGSVLYTLMLAICVAVLITGTWFLGLEVSHYDWQYSRTRVATNKHKVETATDAAPLPPQTANPAAPAK